MACQWCQGRGFVVDPESGDARECDCVFQAQEHVRLVDRRLLAGFPADVRDISEYQGTKSLPVIEKLKIYLRDWETSYRRDTLYVVGEPSTQKTTVWRWLGVELLNRGVNVHYVLFSQLVRTLTHIPALDYQARREAEAYIDALYNSELLIVDEAFDRTKATIWASGSQGSVIDSFFRELLELHQRACVFISNFPVDNIEKVFNPTLQELITRNIKAVLKFEDRLDFNPSISKDTSLWMQ